MPARSKTQQMAAGAAPSVETRKTLEVFAQRGVEKDVRVDEQERTAQGGENKTQKPADKEEAQVA